MKRGKCNCQVYLQNYVQKYVWLKNFQNKKYMYQYDKYKLSLHCVKQEKGKQSQQGGLISVVGIKLFYFQNLASQFKEEFIFMFYREC